ncbi:MAG: tetratricopeptide repeat protein [Candidatus Hodarchaeota archaeon]
MTRTEKLLNRANKLKSNKKYEESIKILEELYSKEPNSEDIRKELINVLFSYGIYLSDEFIMGDKKAIKCFKKIIEIEPDNYRAIYNLGISYFNLGRMKKAIYAYNEAIKIKPDYKHCYYNIGLIYEIMKDFQEALKFYKKALEIDPKFIYALQAKKIVKQKFNSSKRKILQETIITCNNCGNINRDNAKFCDKCGKEL